MERRTPRSEQGSMVRPEPNPFGNMLRRRRLDAGLTQEELAERAGLSVRGLSDLERGSRTRPRPYTIRQLADALQLSTEDRETFRALGLRQLSAGRPASVVNGDDEDRPPGVKVFLIADIRG